MKHFWARVIRGEENSAAVWVLKPFLFIFCVIYAVGVTLLRWAYQVGILKTHPLGKPVISVGNITLGGTGKTPFVAYLAEKVSDLGQRPVILMRGYMSRVGVASDEAEMLRREMPGVPVNVSPDRLRAAAVSIHKDYPDVFILDDGFQHWKAHRDVDIVLIDAMDPFGNGWPLPLGILRELKSGLKRAHLFVITRADLAPERVSSLREELKRINPKAGIAEAAHTPVAIEEPFRKGEAPATDLSVVRDRVCACSAIGSPAGFAAMLQGLGADIVHHEIFIDHHVYTAGDVRRIVTICREKKLDKIVTTRKDMVKLSAFLDLFGEVRLLAVAVAVTVLKGEYEIASCVNRILHP